MKSKSTDKLIDCGNYFLLDPNTMASLFAADATFNVIAAYTVLARFVSNDDSSMAEKTNAGVQAIQRYTGMSRPSAEAAVGWLQNRINPATGLAFLSRHGREIPRAHPRYLLEGVDTNNTIALPNMIVGTPTNPDGTIARIIATAHPIRNDAHLIRAEQIKKQAFRQLLEMYLSVDLQRLGGVPQTVFRIGAARVVENYFQESTGDGVMVQMPELHETPPDLITAARIVLWKASAVRLNLAVMDDEEQIAYTLRYFGPENLDWMPQAYLEMKKHAAYADQWDAQTGVWIGPTAHVYPIALQAGQSVRLAAFPALLAMTAEIEAQKNAYRLLTSRRIQREFALDDINVQ